MTKAQLIVDFKQMIGPAGKGSEVSDAGISVWLNDAYMMIVDKIISTIPDYFAKKATSSIVAGQGEYSLPDDFEKMIMVKVTYDGVTTVMALPMMNIGQATDLVNSTSIDYVSSQPFYYLFKNTMGFLPVFSTTVSDGISIWYAYTPAEMDSDNDEPDLPRRLQQTLKYWAYANYLDQNDEHTAAEVMRRRFDATTGVIIDNLVGMQVQENGGVQISDTMDIY